MLGLISARIPLRRHAVLSGTQGRPNPMENDDKQMIQRLGALTALTAMGEIAIYLAKRQGIDLLPGEDLISGIARQRATSPEIMRGYFTALADCGEPARAKDVAIAAESPLSTRVQ